jgi:L-asparaginase/Glu-tRNA(Gln) amidotransferase subunit D
MAFTHTVNPNYFLNKHKPNHIHNHHTPSASEIFLRTFRSENGIRSVSVNRSKEGQSRVLVLYTGGTIGMMKNDKKGMFNSINLSVH